MPDTQEELPIPDRDVVQPAAIQKGTSVLPLYRQIAGVESDPEAIRYRIVAWTVIDEFDLDSFSRFRWYAKWDKTHGSYVAWRTEESGGELADIYLANEVLGLQRVDGNNANRKLDRASRFKGVYPHDGGFRAEFIHNGKRYHLPTVPLESEAVFMLSHALSLLAQKQDANGK